MGDLKELKENISKVDDSILNSLKEKGCEDLEDFKDLTRDELLEISGVDESTADDVIRFLVKEGKWAEVF